MINFPNNPALGDAFQQGGTVYTCVLVSPVVWNAAPASAAIPEAPLDGLVYGRREAAWKALDKTDVGLSNVDNTSDLAKPISTKTQAALDTKQMVIPFGAATQYWRGDQTWQTLDKYSVGLGNVDNNKQIYDLRPQPNPDGHAIYIGFYNNNLDLQIDGTYMGNRWPVSISGRADTAGTADNAYTANGQRFDWANNNNNPTYLWGADNSGVAYLAWRGGMSVAYADTAGNANGFGGRGEGSYALTDWSRTIGFRSNDTVRPYLTRAGDGAARYLIGQTANDDTLMMIRDAADGGGRYIETTGNAGAFGCRYNVSDIRLKTNIAESQINASDLIKQIDFIEFDWERVGTGHVKLSFSAQNLESLDSALVYSVAQPEERPVKEIDTILHINEGSMMAYLAKGLQEALAEIQTLKEEVSQLKGTQS